MVSRGRCWTLQAPAALQESLLTWNRCFSVGGGGATERPQNKGWSGAWTVEFLEAEVVRVGAGQPSRLSLKSPPMGWLPAHSCVGPALGIDSQLVLF